MPDTVTTIYPTGTAHVLGDPRFGSPPEVITETSPAVADVLLAYSPAAFSRLPTGYSDALEAAGIPHNTIPDGTPPTEAPPPAAAGATEGPTEDAAPAATSPDEPSVETPADEPEVAS
ncbi:MAG TPA: hypothetical protein VMH41_16740 [Mycobacteriales bacterium]|nr:hypothetical protein [Mycobacteriales bacterium]